MAILKTKPQKKWWDDTADKYWKGEIQACLEAMYPDDYDKKQVNENNVIHAILNDDHVWDTINTALGDYIDENITEKKSPKTR